MDIPNLDALSDCELTELYRNLQTLTDYARNSLLARSRRSDGLINKALVYERHCEGLYKELPKDWQW